MILDVTCVVALSSGCERNCPKFVLPCNFDYGDVSYDYVSVYMRRDCRHMTSEFLWNKRFYFIVVS